MCLASMVLRERRPALVRKKGLREIKCAASDRYTSSLILEQA
jgi:hypothetical protein